MARNLTLIPVVKDVPHPRAWGYDGRIDDVLFRLAAAGDAALDIATAEPTPPRVDTALSAEDIRDETGFRYSRANISGGAGLDFLHAPNPPAAAATRFWDSRGVDVFSSDRGDVYEAPLLHVLAQDTAVSGTLLHIGDIDGKIYYTDDAELWEYGASPAKHTLASTAIAFVAMGNSLYTLDATNGVQRFDPPSFTPVSVDATTTYDDMWGAKSRIFAADNNVLFEAAATPIAVLTLPPADRITDVIDAGNAVAVLTTTGTIYLLGLDDALVVTNLGQHTFTSEVPVAGAYAQGVLGIATVAGTDAGGNVIRFYTAEVANDGTSLDDLNVIYQLGDRTATTVRLPDVVFSTRDSIYLVSLEEGETVRTLWRYYLPTGGYARGLEIPVALAPDSIIEIEDRIWMAIPTDGIWKEQDTFIVTGYIIGPAADFFTSDPKQWVSGHLSIVTLPAGAEVDLFDSTQLAALSDPNHASWTLAGKTLGEGTTDLDIDNLTNRDSRYHMAKVVMLSPTSRTVTPAFRSYSFRAFPSSARDTLIRLPVNVSDQFESPQKRAMILRGRGALMERTFRAKEGTQVVCEIYALGLEVRGMLESVEETITVIPDRGNPLNVMFLRIRGEEVLVGGGGSSSGAGFGLDKFAIPQFGVGELG